jgi:hypothetical protein
MELAELLEREGLEPDELMTWARPRADALVAGLAHDEQGEHGEPLLRLLVADASVDVSALSVARSVPEVETVEAVTVEAVTVEAELEEDTVVGARRESVPPQPITVDELPPPPEPPRHAEGQPEPILETFDTGPIDLGTPEATALLAAPPIEPTQEPEQAQPLAEPEQPEAEAEPASEDELEEIEFDELVEIADDELEALDELDDPEDPLPPRRPPPPGQPPVRSGGTAPFAVLDQAPVRTGDTAAHMVVQGDDDEPEDVDLDAPAPASDEDGFDLDLDGI